MAFRSTDAITLSSGERLTVEASVGEERLLGELGIDRVQRAVGRPGKLHAPLVRNPGSGLLSIRRAGTERDLEVGIQVSNVIVVYKGSTQPTWKKRQLSSALPAVDRL